MDDTFGTADVETRQLRALLKLCNKMKIEDEKLKDDPNMKQATLEYWNKELDAIQDGKGESSSTSQVLRQ